jgi:hypothetical protein
MWTLLALVALSQSISAGSYTPADTSGPNGANLEQVGQKTLTVRDGKHLVVVKLTVTLKPIGWPDELIIGPTSSDFELPNQPYRIVSEADIKVDGCRIDQPAPPISGMSMPSGAVLSGFNGKWQLEIGGADGAESYGVRYTFDKRRVLTRELRWGPDHSETATYDIQYDPAVSPQECS